VTPLDSFREKTNPIRSPCRASQPAQATLLLASVRSGKTVRPVTGRGQTIGVRLQPDQLAEIDAWIARQQKPISRPALSVLSSPPGST
jgi:hypothetical protein